jgi:hypothetical protein
VVMVWPCTLPVEAYVQAGRGVEFPRPPCPSCAGPLVWWSGYPRWLRAPDRCHRIFVPRLRCGRCAVSHALLPAFVLAWRLDAAEVIGAVIAQVAGGACGVRPAADLAGVPYTTARGWVRRFRACAPALGTGFAALAVELGGDAPAPAANAAAFAVAVAGAAFAAASSLPGWLTVGAWRFASAVTGGMLIAANITSPFLVIGRRRFMPPVPPLPA